MYGFAETLFWILLIAMAFRYFIWRSRWAELRQGLKFSRDEITKLKLRVEELELVAEASARGPVVTERAARTLAEAAAPGRAVQPVAGPVSPGVAEPVAETLPDLSALADRLDAEAEPAVFPVPEETQAALAEAIAAQANRPEDDSPAAAVGPAAWRRAPAGNEPPPPPRPAPIAEAFARLRGNPDLEAIIGTSWLNKIGVAVLVIGIALLSGYSLQYLGAAGKIGLGAAISLLLLGAGVWLETRRRYMLFARPLIGGGWALLYFTTYAAGAIPASRILFEPWMALAALLAVAAGMILHSLRYRNEIVTGMAYLLGFLAILIGSMEPTSLVATGLLAASFLVIFRFIPWYRLSAGMVVTTWFTVWFWLTHNAQQTAPTPSVFWTIETVLIAYWAMFALADYMRVPQNGEQSWLQRFSVTLNSLAFATLSFLMYVAAFPTSSLHDFFGAIALGAAAAAGVALWRQRDFSRVLHVVLAGANVATAVPFAVGAWDWPAAWILLLWTALAALLIGLGLWRRQLAYRVEGYLIGALATAMTFTWAVAPVSLFGALGALALAGWRWPTVIIVAAALYGGELALLWYRERVTRLESMLGTVAGYAATALLAVLVWRDIDSQYLGLLWLAGGLLSFEFGLQVGNLHMRIRGYLLAAVALIAILLNDAGLPYLQFGAAHEPWLWLSLGLGALGYLWLAFRLRRSAARLLPAEAEYAAVPAHISALLVALLLWNELPAAAVTLGWGALALAYREAGAQLKLPVLRQEAYAFIVIAWVRMFMVDFAVAGELFGVSMRLWTALPIAAVLYYFRHTTEALADETPWGQIERRLPVSFSFMAIAGLLVMVWLEVEPSLQVFVWTLFAAALLLAGTRLRLGDYRLQAYLLMAAGLVHLFAIDFAASSVVLGMSSRIIDGVPLIALLYACRFVPGSVARGDLPGQLERQLPTIASFAGAATLAALVWFELEPSATMAVGWSLLALALYAAGVLWRQWDYRVQAYLLALLAFGQIMFDNVSYEYGFAGPFEQVWASAAVALTLLLLALVWRRRRAELATGGSQAAIERWVTPGFVACSALLTMVLIYATAEYNFITLGWAIEALVAIGLGFAVKERSLRLSGLGLLAICLAKGLILDLSGADAIVRIVSFIGLGLILVAISFVYTRYRHVLRTII